MELRDEIRSAFERAHKLAKKYYDEGDSGKARVEYLKCAQFADRLADLTPGKRSELKEKASRFREIGEGLKEGNIKVYTDGVKPPRSEPQPASVQEEGDKKDKIMDLILVEKPGIRFKDIAGLKNIKEAIKEAIIYPFKYPEKYEYFGVKPGGGILLYGPPGCGKTMLAAAAAAECDAAFINVKISDIKDKYVGESEKNIREVFSLAREQERAIIFFDEIDAIASDRSSSREGYERGMVNELLTQMDGVDNKSKNKQLVLAATNIPWAVDTALRRSGRFDTMVFIPNPDEAARKKIFEINLKNKPLSGKVNLDDLVKKTKGYASSEIVDICDKAARIPLREELQGKPRRKIEPEDFEKVIREKKTILESWYVKAMRELGKGDEANLYSELIEAGKSYVIG